VAFPGAFREMARLATGRGFGVSSARRGPYIARASILLKIFRKLAAIAALLALLLPGLSSLAQTLSAADLPPCCSSTFCPMHHREGRNSQAGQNNCNGMGAPGQGDSSMRGCDATPNPAVASPIFVLPAIVSLSGPAMAEVAPASASAFLPYVATIPLTPPPRTFPS
jgi:hypothetical protein